MDLKAFHKKIKELCYPTGYSQKMMARELGLQASALSNKLNGTGETSLKHAEIRQIIKVLARWEALTRQSEALVLLEMMEMRVSSFSLEDWNSPPLDRLTPDLNLGELYLSPDKLSKESMAIPFSKKSNISSDYLLGGGERKQPHLPHHPNPLIGRKQSIAYIVGLLTRSEVPLLTLTGSGGVGKTRLALQVAHEVLNDFEDGVFFVSLAAITDPALLFSMIARTLGLPESTNHTVAEVLTSYLQDKHLLLILDNFEHILPAAVSIKELTSTLPGLKILITSRVLLRIYGEFEYPLDPLTLINPTLIMGKSSPEILEIVSSYDAINLFVQRAAAAKPGFKLNLDNALLIAQICQRLDGLPLAIELAAARVKNIGLRVILSKLDNRLQLLNRGSLDLPERQQTLRAMIDWSYDLLDELEKKLFIGLAVFAGGGDLSAIEKIFHPPAFKLISPQSGLLDKLSDLVDKSILHVTYHSEDEPRFNMLETLREYAMEKLQSNEEQQFIFEQHAKYFLQLAEQSNQVLSQGYHKGWLDRMEIEQGNLRAALSWALSHLEQGQTELTLKLAGNLWRFWQMNSHFKESQLTIMTVLDKTAAYSQELDIKLRAEVLQGASALFSISDCTQAIELQQENLALRRTMQDKAGIVGALNEISCLFLHQTSFHQAASFSRESLELARNWADISGIAEALFHLSVVALFEGNSFQASQYVHECLQIWQELDNQEGIGVAYAQLGRIALKGGQYQQARIKLLKALSILIALDNKIEIIKVLGNLSELLTFQQFPVVAAQQAAVLLGAVLSISKTLCIEMSPLLKSFYNSQVKRMQTQLDENDFANCLAQGSKLDLNQAIKLAQEEVELCDNMISLPSCEFQSILIHSALVNPKASLPDSLTQREVEVLRLLATGITTSQIALKLVVSPLTIQAHIRSIYSKLEVSSRSAATRYAIEKRLV